MTDEKKPLLPTLAELPSLPDLPPRSALPTLPEPGVSPARTFKAPSIELPALPDVPTAPPAPAPNEVAAAATKALGAVPGLEVPSGAPALPAPPVAVAPTADPAVAAAIAQAKALQEVDDAISDVAGSHAELPGTLAMLNDIIAALGG